jgi:small ligand-binding sensory domain FIST
MQPSTLTSRIAAGVSTAPGTAAAGDEAAREAAAGLAGAPTDVAFVFLSPEHLDAVPAALAAVEEHLAPDALVGCVAQGVIGHDRELEHGPGVAVWAASLPGARIESFHAQAVEADGETVVAGFPELLDPAVVALLVDPFSFPAAPFLARLNAERPGLPLVGGIATGGGRPESQALIAGSEVHAGGAVGVAISGARSVTVVSQGCAPIGRDLVITRAEGNVVFELAGQPALERLRAEIGSLTPEQREQAALGILAGLVIDENLPAYERGDYLMRGVLGADEQTGAIAVGEQVRVGQTLRFHVRDARSADEELRAGLAEEVGGKAAAGALLFSCNGRGTNMFSEPDHDARTVAELLGTRAVSGFFCGGELGPVGRKVFLHGFTATLAVFLRD